MIRQLQALVLVALTATANAAAVNLRPRDNSTLISLPQYDSNPAARAAAVAVKKAVTFMAPPLSEMPLSTHLALSEMLA